MSESRHKAVRTGSSSTPFLVNEGFLFMVSLDIATLDKAFVISLRQ